MGFKVCIIGKLISGANLPLEAFVRRHRRNAIGIAFLLDYIYTLAHILSNFLLPYPPLSVLLKLMYTFML